MVDQHKIPDDLQVTQETERGGYSTRTSGKYKRNLVILGIVSVGFIVGGLVWFLALRTTTPLPKKVIGNPPPLTAKRAEASLSQSPLKGKDKKLLELSVAYSYLYEGNKDKAELLAMKYVKDTEVQQDAKCLLQQVYEKGNKPSLKAYQGSCKNEE